MTNPNFLATRPTPVLTLHIEADTMVELLTKLDQIMATMGVDPEKIGRVRYTEGDPAVQMDVYGTTEDAQEAAETHAAKAPKKRTKTPAAAAPSLETQPMPDKTLEPAPAATFDPLSLNDLGGQETVGEAEYETQNDDILSVAAASPAAEAQSTLSPAEARAKAIQLSMQHFAANPTSASDYQRLAQTLGVKDFSAVSDADAHKLLAEVQLLASGVTAAA